MIFKDSVSDQRSLVDIYDDLPVVVISGTQNVGQLLRDNDADLYTVKKTAGIYTSHVYPILSTGSRQTWQIVNRKLKIKSDSVGKRKGRRRKVLTLNP